MAGADTKAGFGGARAARYCLRVTESPAPSPSPARDGYIKARGGGRGDPWAGGRLGQGWVVPGILPTRPPGPLPLPASSGPWLPATGLSEKRAGGRGREGRGGKAGGGGGERGACEKGPGPRRLEPGWLETRTLGLGMGGIQAGVS